MTGVGVLHGVDGEEAESVDRELVEIPFRHVVSLTDGPRQARISGKSWKSAEVISVTLRLFSLRPLGSPGSYGPPPAASPARKCDFGRPMRRQKSQTQAIEPCDHEPNERWISSAAEPSVGREQKEADAHEADPRRATTRNRGRNVAPAKQQRPAQMCGRSVPQL